MRKTVLALAVVGSVLLPTAPATAQEVPTTDLSSVTGLSADQLAAIASFEQGAPVSAAGAAKPTKGSVSAAATRRASYYRGSFLMWTRDNVDFGYNWSSVQWTSAFQQAGYVFPNVARNRGISKYYNTTRNDRFRAVNTIGAGIVTPWGDVKVYSSDYVHRLSVWADGAWSAWSD